VDDGCVASIVGHGDRWWIDVGNRTLSKSLLVKVSKALLASVCTLGMRRTFIRNDKAA
jgi:hypothetical protein